MGRRLAFLAIVCLGTWGAWVHSATRASSPSAPVAVGEESGAQPHGVERLTPPVEVAEGTRRVRIAALGWDAPDAKARVLWDEIFDLARGQDTAFRLDAELPSLASRPPADGVTVGWHLPGATPAAPPPPEPPQRVHLASQALLRLEPDGRLAWSGGRGKGAVAEDGLAVLELVLGERSAIFLARLVQAGESGGAWGVAEWERAVAADLERKTGAPNSDALLLAEWIPMPAAVPGLRRIADRVDAEVGPALLRARVLARDLAPLVAGDAWERLADPIWLGRLAGTTNHPRVRERALAAGGGAFGPALEPEEDTRLPTPVAVLLGLALLALGLLLLRGGSVEPRTRAAVWMVFVGTAMSMVSVHLGARDLGFELLGWLWTAAGALVLGENALGGGGRLPGAALLLACLCAVVDRFAHGTGPWDEWGALLAAIGFGTLPLLALALRPPRQAGFPWVPVAVCLGLPYAVWVGRAAPGAGHRLLQAYVGVSLLGLLLGAYARGRGRRPGLRTGRVAALGVALLAVGLGASLWFTRIPLPAGISMANASWYASQASLDLGAGRPEEAAQGYQSALEALDWWRMQTGAPLLPPRYPAREAREALVGLGRARAGIAKRRVGTWALPTAEAAAVDGLLELPSPGWAKALFGREAPTELARERRELLRVVALGESHRRSASGVLTALRALGESSLVDPVALDRLGRLLVAPNPAVRLDGLFVLRVLATEADLSLAEQRALWTFLGGDPDRLAGLVVDVANELVDPELTPLEQRRGWAFLRRFAHETAPFTGVKLAEDLARRVGDGAPIRPILVELICRVGDLPISLDGAADGLPESQPPLEDAALTLWREVRGLPRAKGWWRRIAYAIQALPPAGAHTTPWLARHTAQDAMSRTDWREWLSVASLVEPALGLADVAGIEADLAEMAEDELLEIVYPREGRGEDRALVPDAVARLAYVLFLSVDDDVRAPVWCAPQNRLTPWESEPLAMCAAWHTALASLLGERRFRIRVARYAWEGEEVRAPWDDVLDVGLEERAPVHQRLGEIGEGETGEGETTPVFRRSFQVTWDPATGYRLDPRPTQGAAAGPREVATYVLPSRPGASDALAVFGDAAIPESWSIDPTAHLPPRYAPVADRAEDDATGASPRNYLPVVLAVAVGFWVVLLLSSGKAPRRRRIVAGVLVVTGLALLRGPDHGAYGLALATLGSLVLARSAGRGAGWISPAAFLVATVLSVARARGWGSEALPEVVTAWTTLAVVALPLLAGALWPTARRVEWLVAYALLGLALHLALPADRSVWLTVWIALALLSLLRGAARGPTPMPANTRRRRGRARPRRR